MIGTGGIGSLDIENVSIHFTDPTGSFRQRGGLRKGQNLQFALMDLVSEAENEISLLPSECHLGARTGFYTMRYREGYLVG